MENCPIEKETRQFKDANIFANFVILHVKFFEIEWLIESKMKVSCVKKKIEIVRLYIENKNGYKEKDGAISYI